jgi:D-lactate dehydrogenase
MEANKSTRFSYESVRGFELKNKTLGVVGSGRIGLHAIRIAKAFGMEVVAYDLHPQPFMAEILGFRYVTFEELLQASDIITLHIPLFPATYHLLNRDAFAQCKRGVLIINTARGALIDTEALLEALDNGTVRGAGLDVLEEERVLQKEMMNIISDQIVSRLQSGRPAHELRASNPERIQELQGLMRNTELISRSNVVFTPHVAFNSVEAVARINETVVRNVRAFATGKPINLAH